MAIRTGRVAVVVASVVTLIGTSACGAEEQSAATPSMVVGGSADPSLTPSNDPLATPSAAVPSGGTTTTSPADPTNSPTTKSPPTPTPAKTTAPPTSTKPADRTAPVIAKSVTSSATYIWKTGCRFKSALLSAEVTDATDAPGRLKVTAAWRSKVSTASGTIAMSYNSSTGRFEVRLPGAPDIPKGDATFTVHATDAAGNKATPVVGPTLESLDFCGG
ncbi:hypothetical protein ACWDV4_29235 [Micromonospora sp. NPDC003197]